MPSRYNGACIQLLEEALARAREGRVEALGIVIAEKPARDDMPVPATATFAANSEMTAPIIDYTRQMLGMLERIQENQTLPPRTANLPANYACYDFAMGPASFDFANWLIGREMDRIAAGAPAPLRSAWVFGWDAIGGRASIAGSAG